MFVRVLTIHLSLTVLATLAVPRDVAAQRRPKVLFIAQGSLPGPLRRAIPVLLGREANLISTGDYVADARRRGMSPASSNAMRRVGTQQGADVIAVAGFHAAGRSRTLHMTYRHGRTGELLLRQSHRLPGVRLGAAAQHAIIREVGMAASNVRPARRATRPRREPVAAAPARAPARRATRRRARPPEPAPAPPPEEVEEEEEEEEADSGDDGGLPPPVDWSGGGDVGGAAEALDDADDVEEDVEDEIEEEDVAENEEIDDEEASEVGGDGEGSAIDGFGFDVQAGLGFGTRSSAIPTEAGPARLSTSPFPALHVGLHVTLLGNDDQSLQIGVGARYNTSVGLKTQDIRPDGTTRTVDARSQYLGLGVDLRVELSDGDRPAVMSLSAGYQFRLLSTDVPISLPEYTLSGPYARAGLEFPLGSGPMTLTIAPEIGSVSGVSEEIQQLGRVSSGLAVGAEASIRLGVFDSLDVELLYRESHALIDSELDEGMSDVERWGILRAIYRP